MKQSNKHQYRLKLLKKYFAEESEERIVQEWEKAGEKIIGGLTIGEFLKMKGEVLENTKP